LSCSKLFYAEVMRIAGAVFGLGVGMMVAAAVGCRSLPPPVPLDQLNAQQMRGHAVFQAQCAQCHYDRRDASLHGPALVGVFKKPSLPSGAPANDDRVTATILNGKSLMPAMRDRMDAQDVADVLAYLHTL
jgi:mono/diheme cytochrome c family protein